MINSVVKCLSVSSPEEKPSLSYSKRSSEMRIVRFVCLVTVVFALLSVILDSKRNVVSLPLWSSHKIAPLTDAQVKATCTGAVHASNSGSAAQTACSDCTATCQSHFDNCKNGNQAECYEAAACLCQCNLDAGGCGSDRGALQKCVDDNKREAQKYR